MLQNNLDPEVAERPDDLVVYGGTGRAARSWDAFDAMLRTPSPRSPTTRRCSSSRASRSACSRTHEWAPRVLIANSNLVPEWANWDEFRRLEALGLTMYGQMTAGSWIYIGTQGILQGTYECFAEIARRRFGGSLAGTITLTAGARRDGWRPAAGRHDERRRGAVHRRRPASAPATARDRYLDEVAGSVDDAVRRCLDARDRRDGAVGRPRRQRRRRRAAPPRAVASPPTSSPTRRAPTIRSATCPLDLTPEAAAEMAATDPDELVRRARLVDGHPLRGDGRIHGPRRRGVRLRQQPARRSQARRLRPRLRLPRLPAGLHPTAVLRGQGSVPLGRAVGRSRPTSPPPTAPCSRSSPTTTTCAAGSTLAGERVAFQGLPARICWLGYGERHRLGLRFNEMVRTGAAVGADRDRPRPPRLRARSHRPTARPRRWPTGPTRSPTGRCSTPSSTRRAGATWVSIHHGGGVGIGRSIHAGHGRRRRRHRPRRREAGAGAHQRSRHGRDPPRRRRLRPRASRWPRARRAHPDGRTSR